MQEVGVQHASYSPDHDAEDPSKPFFLNSDFPKVDDLRNCIFVRRIFGSFQVDHTSIEEDELSNLLAGGVQSAIVLAEKTFGKIDEYVTDTERLVIIER